MHYDFILSSAAVKNVRIKTLADVLPVHLLEELGLLVDAHVLHEFLDGSYLRRIKSLQQTILAADTIAAWEMVQLLTNLDDVLGAASPFFARRLGTTTEAGFARLK